MALNCNNVRLHIFERLFVQETQQRYNELEFDSVTTFSRSLSPFIHAFIRMGVVAREEILFNDETV